MLSSLGRNLRAFLWALAIAFAVWIAAVTAADPDEVRIYPTPIKVEVVGQDPSLIIYSNIPKEVQVTLRAPAIGLEPTDGSPRWRPRNPRSLRS